LGNTLLPDGEGMDRKWSPQRQKAVEEPPWYVYLLLKIHSTPLIKLTEENLTFQRFQK
jgi:hypothetical protein